MGTMYSVIKVAYVRPPMMTMDILLISWLAMSLLNSTIIMPRMVVRAVIRMGRIRVLPVAIRASRRSMPPSRSWLV